MPVSRFWEPAGYASLARAYRRAYLMAVRRPRQRRVKSGRARSLKASAVTPIQRERERIEHREKRAMDMRLRMKRAGLLGFAD